MQFFLAGAVTEAEPVYVFFYLQRLEAAGGSGAVLETAVY